MKKPLLAAVLGTMAMSLVAVTLEAKTVECKAQVDGKTQSISFQMNNAGKILQNNEDGTWAKTDENSIFYVFTWNEESGVESDSSFVDKDGNSVVKIVTTAEVVMVSISPDGTRGEYSYEDIGSGNGNNKLPLTCAVKTQKMASGFWKNWTVSDQKEKQGFWKNW